MSKARWALAVVSSREPRPPTSRPFWVRLEDPSSLWRLQHWASEPPEGAVVASDIAFDGCQKIALVDLVATNAQILSFQSRCTLQFHWFCSSITGMRKAGYKVFCRDAVEVIPVVRHI